jgi:UDP-glucose 6-dehydrogenase
MKVTIVGSGNVGLVTAVGLCEKGHDVTCVVVTPPATRGSATYALGERA